LLDAQLIVGAFSLMGCDAVGIGADDLRLGAKDFTQIKKMAEFPVISANVVGKDGSLVSAASVVTIAGGLRWGIFSLMGANPASISNTRGWKILDPVSTGTQVIKELQDKADIIILLAAMPLDELRALLPQLPGVTIAVVGGEPAGLLRPLLIGQTTVVCIPGYGKYLGMLHLSLRDPRAPFADEAEITELETELAVAEKNMKEGALRSSQEEKKKIEERFQELKTGNIYRNEIIVLSSQFQDEQGVQHLIDDFRTTKAAKGKGCQ
jgi:2',3'-cyclic-nucleotide 2'-phosphodiesterase (5'-nucleotidase family)